MQVRQDETKTIGVGAQGLVIPGLFNVSNRIGTPDANEFNAKARQVGIYAEARIGYKNYLFLHGTGRQDRVSILAPGNNTFFYPSVDVSFVASDAIPLLKNSKVISYLKLRGGWAKVGQVNLRNGFYGAYQLLPTYYQAYGYPYGSSPGFTVGDVLVSNNLKPEITTGPEFGFDLNLFKDRFTSSVTYYHTKTDNQTISTKVSTASGFTNLLTNVGATESKGLEVTAHVTPIRNSDWSVTVGGNYTYLNNNVLALSTDLTRLSIATYGTDGPGSYAVPGRPFPVIMGYDYQRDPQGHVIVDGITGWPKKADTISYLGSAVYPNKLSLDASVTYKNFTLGVLFDYRGGAVMYNNMGPEMDWSGTGYRTAIYNRERFVFPNSVINTGTADNPVYVKNTNVTLKDGGGNAGFWTDGTNRDVTSNYITSADFWKLREISLAYDFPDSFLGSRKVIKGVRISAQARNLFVWLPKDNLYTDPEYSDAGNDSNGIGLTGIGQTPPSRFYGATVTFKF